MRLIIDSKMQRIEISNIGRIDDIGCELELYSDSACVDPMEILIGGYWAIAYADQYTIEKSHLQSVDAIYLIPDELKLELNSEEG